MREDAARRGRRSAAVVAAAIAAIAAIGAPAAAQPAPSPSPLSPDDARSLELKRSASPVDPQLARLAATDASAPSAPGRAAPSAATPLAAWPWLRRADGIVIHAASNGDPRALLAELEALGLADGRVAGNAVSGVLPPEAVDRLDTCASLAAVRPAMATTRRGRGRVPRPPRARDRGAATSQGVAALRVDRLPRAQDGAGTRVGILSDTLDCLGGGLARDVASGDLPADVALLDDPALLGCSDEGRALAQIVHDVSPGSGLGFHTAFNGQADFAAGIAELAHAFGADVIVDDVVYFDEPFFQDGPIARAVEAVHRAGVTYVAAAGNAGRRAHDAPFRDSGQTGFFQSLGETRRHDFDPGPGVDVFNRMVVPPGSQTVLVLQWDEPFVSASTASPPVGAASDYDLLVYTVEDPPPLRFDLVFARSTAFNVGGDAVEALVLRNPGPTPITVHAAIERFMRPGYDGPDVERMKLVTFGASLEPEWPNGGATSFGHANAEGAVAVGAAAWYATPRFGVSPPRLEGFSSAGGVPIVLAPSGERLAEPVVRETPDLVGPDGVNTTFFASPGDIPEDDDTLPNFFGTSAAAPHVAGVAALLQGRVRGGAAVTDRDGRLRALRMCVAWRLGPFLGIPLTFPVPPEHVEAALDAGATLGPCWKLPPGKIERLLEATAVDMAAPGYDRDSGHGLVDARGAWRALSWILRGPFRGASGR